MPLPSMDDVSAILERPVSLGSFNLLCQVRFVTISYVLQLAFFSVYVAPHPNTVRRSLQQLYQVHRARLKEKLQNMDWMSITCGFWSIRSSKSFLVLTCHYLSSKFELNNFILNFYCFDERHLGDKIANTIHSKLEQLGVLSNVTAVPFDGASNMKKAFEKFTNIDRIWCLVH
jgi:hypothetical protein